MATCCCWWLRLTTSSMRILPFRNVTVSPQGMCGVDRCNVTILHKQCVGVGNCGDSVDCGCGCGNFSGATEGDQKS